MTDQTSQNLQDPERSLLGDSTENLETTAQKGVITETVENVKEIHETLPNIESEPLEKLTEESVKEEIFIEEAGINDNPENSSLNEESVRETELKADDLDFQSVNPELDKNDTTFDSLNMDMDDSEIEEIGNEEIIDFSTLTNEEILDKLRYLIHETNIEESRKDIESLRNQYYKNQKIQFEQIKKELKEKAGDDVEIEMPKDPNEDYLKELMNDFRKKRAEFIQKQEEEKNNNLKLKLEIIEKIKGLANSEESLNKTFSEFKALQKQWLEIGPVPNSEATGLWKNYQLQIERFYDLVKINNELRDLDFKKNLEQKIELCEKAEELLLEPDVVIAYKKLQELHNLWKELGPVPAEKREEIWDRFSTISKKIRQSYQEHFEKLKEERNANYEQKLLLCEKVESLISENIPQNGKEWTEVSDQIIELQKIWKTIGMVPNNVNNEVYERFRSACNKFFDSKKEFFNVINNELSTNLQKKIELCVNAELIQNNTDWKKTTEMFLDLQKRWKEIGPVPKKNSEQVWKRFRAACDHFFNAKSNYFANIENEQQENLKKKEELIAEILGYVPVENQNENIEKIKSFQTRWTEIGYVANSEKDRLYNDYRKSINSIYEKINLNRNSIETSNFSNRVENIKESGSTYALDKERNKILQRIKDLNAEINQIENNMGFFASGSDNIIKEFNKKIEKAKEEINLLKEKKKIIDLAERELKQKENTNE